MKIEKSNSPGLRYSTSVHRKQEDFKFHVRKYPDSTSLIPMNMLTSVLKGAIAYHTGLCTLFQDFLQATARTAGYLMCNGLLASIAYKVFDSVLYNKTSPTHIKFKSRQINGNNVFNKNNLPRLMQQFKNRACYFRTIIKKEKEPPCDYAKARLKERHN
jgi:hypothetical protein